MHVLENAKEKLRKAQVRKAVLVLAVGVGDQVDVNTIGGIASTNVKHFINVKDFFVGLSQSMTVVCSSRVGETIPLPVPGWTDVDA